MKEIKVVKVTPIETKDGKKFTAYKTVGKDGKLLDLRFRRDVTNTPTEPCVIVVADGNANVDTTRQYPVVWVNEIEEIKPLERKSNIDEFI